jgi:hypothetical protein
MYEYIEKLKKASVWFLTYFCQNCTDYFLEIRFYACNFKEIDFLSFPYFKSDFDLKNYKLPGGALKNASGFPANPVQADGNLCNFFNILPFYCKINGEVL